MMPYKEGIAELRKKKASFRTIVHLLKQSGITVSHDTVFRFCRAYIKPEQHSKRKSRPDVRGMAEAERPLSQPSPKDDAERPNRVRPLSEQPQNDAAASVITRKRRGPRIADPRNV